MYGIIIWTVLLVGSIYFNLTQYLYYKFMLGL